ncbi:hypothetical protein [Carnobacterium divergens]|nr:hypothetical protein [Carnobacterium divergens]MDT2012925.1 hypothetical protein [Carnobacterium divergens]
MIVDLKFMLLNAIEKYGEFSLAVLSLRLTYLEYLLKKKTLDITLIDQLQNDIEITYNSDVRPESKLKEYMFRSNTNDNVIYKFSSDYFYENYHSVIPDIEQHIIRIKNYKELSLCKDLRWYVYALTNDDELILLNNPMNAIDLVLNRNDYKINNIAAVHPMLVYKEDFEARMVGEVAIIYDDAGNLPVSVIINNKSGHYRPLAKDLRYVVDFFKTVLGIDSNRIICINITC